MEMMLTRLIKTENSTIGELKINGQFECYILEDMDRGLSKMMPLSQISSLKVKGKTCIPEGKYEIAISFSNKFQKLLPQLNDVPGFAGIRIHTGNVSADTMGCLLPGKTKENEKVVNSKDAFEGLFKKLQSAMTNEKVYITIQ